MSAHTIEQRLERVEAELELGRSRGHVYDLLFDYARSCDTKDAKSVASLFAPNASLLIASGPIEGRNAIREFYAGALLDPCKHYITNTRCSHDGSVHVVRSEFLAIHWTAAGARLTWGSYDDRVTVADGKAMFAVRQITIDGRRPFGAET